MTRDNKQSESEMSQASEGVEYYSAGTRAADVFAGWVLKSRLISAGVLLAITLLAFVGISRLGFNAELRSLFEADAGQMKQLDTIRRQFRGDDKTVLLLLKSDDIFSPEAASAIRTLDRELERIDGVGSVTSLADVAVVVQAETGMSFIMPEPFPDWPVGVQLTWPIASSQPLLPDFEADEQRFQAAANRAEHHPLVDGWLLSADEKYCCLFIGLAGESVEIGEIRRRTADIRRLVRNTLEKTHIEYYLTGIPVSRIALLDAMQREQAIFITVGLVAGGLVVWLIFRHVAATCAVLLPAIAAPIWVAGLLGLTGGAINPVNAITPVLVLIIALADGVHVVNAVRASLSRGSGPKTAGREAIREVGPACMVTSITTAIGFASLVVARVDVIQYFGLTAAAGVLLSLFATLTIVPIVSSFLFEWWGDRTGWTSRQAPRILPEKLLVGYLKTPFAVATVGAIVTVGCGYAWHYLQPSTSFRGTLPKNSNAWTGSTVMDEQFGGSLSVIGLIEWDEKQEWTDPTVLNAIRDTSTVMAETRTLSHPVSVLSLLPTMLDMANDPDEVAKWMMKIPSAERKRFVRPDLQRAVVVARVPDHGTYQHLPVLKDLRLRLNGIEQRHPGVHISLSGTPVAIGENAAKMIRDLEFSLATAAVVILLVMIVAFRSYRLGLVVILPNALPLAVAGAWLVATGQVLTITGTITFCVVLGIAVDDTTHMIHRYKRELAAGGDIDEVLRRSFHTVGTAVIVTTAVFLVGMGSLLFSNLPGLRTFGQIACVGLVAAVVADLILLPALLKIVTPYLPDSARRPWGSGSSKDEPH